ncbi:MAG: CoA transferase [Rubrobacter sp.]|nr:CoA transferase [Rubrobacter sp.]
MNAPLEGMKVVTLAVNVPGPAAASRLREFGASVTKVEPPGGDPLEASNPAWHRAMATGQNIVALDLKDEGDLRELASLLENADLLLTSNRPASLARLGLSPEDVAGKYPNLAYVAIVGYPSPRENDPGHDLTYLADYGLLTPPDMPRTLLADLAGAERAASAALGLLLGRERGFGAGYAEVPLSEAAEAFAAPFRHGITRPGELLGGGFAGYNVYRTSDGWIAVAALEAHFLAKLLSELGLEKADKERMERIFAEHPSSRWEKWAAERDLPIAALEEPE